MENFYKNMLNKIFVMRSDEFESIFAREHENQLEKNGTRKKQADLYNAIEDAVGRENGIFKKINTLFNNYDAAYLEEINYWMEKYYKLGFCDCMNIKDEVKKENSKNQENNETCFLDEYSDDLCDYIEDNRHSNWMKKTEYTELQDKISTIKSKYPNVQEFLENAEYNILTKEELEAVRKILELEHNIDTLEEKEIFKLGMKENYIYMKRMNM